MFKWFFSLPIDTRINIIVALTTTLLSIISVSIALISLLKSNKITNESNRPCIVITLETISVCSIRTKYLVLKNFGNTSAKVVSITCSKDVDFCCGLNPFLDLINFTIAPYQSIVTACDFKDNRDPFTFTILYSNNNRNFTDTCYINPNITNNLLSTSNGSSRMSSLEKTLINSTEELIKSKF